MLSRLLVVSSLAVFLSSLTVSVTPVAALSIESRGHVASRHHSIAESSLTKNLKKKRSNSKRCKAKSSSSVSSSVSSSASHSKSSSTTHPTSTSTSKAPAATHSNPPTSINTGGQKVGIAWNDDDTSTLKFYKTSNTKFLYTWSPFCPDGAKDLGFTCVPMLWGDKQIDQFTSLVKPGYSNYVLGFNEPNQSGQSDMDPSYAASVWKQHIQPLKSQGYNLISPACTNAPSGKTWYQDFFKACDGCTFSALATHFYGTDPDDLISYLKDLHDTFNLPIWLTEFACQNFGSGGQASDSEVEAFLSKVTAFMEETDWVQAYFAFGVLPDMSGVNPANQLMGSNGKPNALGLKYINP